MPTSDRPIGFRKPEAPIVCIGIDLVVTSMPMPGSRGAGCSRASAFGGGGCYGDMTGG